MGMEGMSMFTRANYTKANFEATFGKVKVNIDGKMDQDFKDLLHVDTNRDMG